MRYRFHENPVLHPHGSCMVREGCHRLCNWSVQEPISYYVLVAEKVNDHIIKRLLRHMHTRGQSGTLTPAFLTYRKLLSSFDVLFRVL